MLRSWVTELHYIAPVANLGSIVTRGVLSHNLAARLPHAPASVVDERVQDHRGGKRVPRGLPLHDYANLYFDARNPMMYTPQAQTIVNTVTSPVVSAGVTVASASEDVVIDQDGSQGRSDQVGTLSAVGECIPYCADVVQRVGSLS